MFDRISNSWRLFRSTLDVLSKDKELVVFPIVSGVASILVMASFAGGMWGAGLMDELMQMADRRSDGDQFTSAHAAVIGIGLAFHFVNYFLMTYFNAGLIGAAFIRLRGGDPTVADGFAAANRCLPAILGYSLIAGSVGLLLNMLQRQARDNFIGRIVVGLLGMAWTLITYLVVPVLVLERIGPVDAIKRSTSLLKKTWGEQIISNFGFGLIAFLFSLVGFLFVVVGVYAIVAKASVAIIAALFVAAVGYWVLLGIVMSALRGIYTAALYTYATNQEIQLRGFPVELLSSAFSRR